jgi:hypothetical protein
MPAITFKQHLNQLALQPNDQQKLQFSKTILQGSCLLSSQVKDLATVFAGDYYRYEFCKRAWKHTFDPGNFFDVYDAFGSFSAAIRLYDFISSNEITSINPPTSTTNWYPELSYPVPFGYKGITGCQIPLADNDFEIVARPAVIQKTDAAHRAEALKIFNTHCVSMGQAMKLATLFEMESNRIAFLKEVYPKIHDMENYSFATEVFSHIPYKNEWLAFCPSILETSAVSPEPPAMICEVSPAEFEDIKRSISNVSVNSTKLTLAKQIISTKKCFTVKQLAGIIALFSIESSRLEVALSSYDYCINKADYYQLTDSFTTTSSKDELLEFIGNK